MIATFRVSPLVIVFSAAIVMIGCSSPDPLVDLPNLPAYDSTPAIVSSSLNPPTRLTTAGGDPIDIGVLSRNAHAGPWVADVDQDGDRDLVVGDFPGYFWLFTNEATDASPEYASGVKLQAGGKDAKTPVY